MPHEHHNVENTSTVVLVRHGRTQWNQLGRWQGQLDSDLIPEGIAGALSVGTSVLGWF